MTNNQLAGADAGRAQCHETNRKLAGYADECIGDQRNFTTTAC